MNARSNVGRFVELALEFSIYLAPTDIGLELDELVTAGQQLGFQKGEIADATEGREVARWEGSRLIPGVTTCALLCDFASQLHEPDYRNLDAFEFVRNELIDAAREMGAARAAIDREVLVERGVARQLARLDVQAAITAMNLANQLNLAEGAVRLTDIGRTWLDFGPAAQRAQIQGRQRQADPFRIRVHGAVRDVIARRNDGRPKHHEPLEAFADALAPLGYAPFRMWWTQTVAELRRQEPSTAPVSVAVLSAALVEGALTFIVKYARTQGLGPFQSKDFEKEPRAWKLEELVASASTGKDNAVLRPTTRTRTDSLIRTRQRIHAGRMLAEYPQGVPDLRPEEARDAKATAELVVREVLDWLERHRHASSTTT